MLVQSAPSFGGEVSSRYDKSAPKVQLLGESPGSFSAKNWVIREGRALAELDMDAVHDVCVLGAGLATTLFPYGSATGDRVKISGIKYTVIGVLEPKGAMLGGDQDNFAIIPISTGVNRFGRIWRSVSIRSRRSDRVSSSDSRLDSRPLSWACCEI